MVAKFGTFTTPTSTGNVSYTGVGFQPKLLLLWGNGRATTDPYPVQSSDIRMCFGATDGTRQGCVIQTGNDGNPGARHHIRNDRAFGWYESGAFFASAEIVSFDEDGFTLNHTVATIEAEVQYLALGGDDLTDVRVDSHSFVSGTTGNQSVTGVGFQPDMVMCFFGLTGGSFNTERPDRGAAWGMSDGVREASLHDKRAQDIIDTQAANVSNAGVGNSHFIRCYDSSTSGSTQWSAAFESFDADGFTYRNVATDAANTPGIYIALRGGDYALSGMQTTPLVPGTQAITGFGFEPEAVMFFSRSRPSSPNGNDCPPTVGGGSSPTDRGFMAWYHESSGGDNAAAAQRSDRMIDLMIRGDSAAALNPTEPAYEGDLDSIDADGLTIDWTAVNTQAEAKEYFVLGFGGLGGGGGGGGGAGLPPGWGGPGKPPFGTGPPDPGGPPAASGAPPGTAPGYGYTDPVRRAGQLVNSLAESGLFPNCVAIGATDNPPPQSLSYSLTRLLYCLQNRPTPPVGQSVEFCLNAIYVELGIERPRRMTLAQELDTIAANLPSS